MVAIDQLGDDLFRAALAAVLAAYNGRAASLAASAFAAQAMAATHRAVAVSVGAVPDDTDRLAKAATTVARRGPRLGGARRHHRPAGPRRTVDTAARTYSGQLAASPLVEGWTRAMDAAPCQLCRWWWREGRVWPKNHPFQTHTGCACVPRPVWAKNIRSTATHAGGTEHRPTKTTPRTESIEAVRTNRAPPRVTTDATPEERVLRRPSPETFPREVVEKLRQENGRYRQRAQQADTLARRLHLELVRATGRLADPSDLEFDEEHLDDPDALVAAVDELLAANRTSPPPACR